MSNKFTAARGSHRTPKICKPPPPPVPIPPPPPADVSYIDAHVKYGDWDDEEGDCFGEWEYQRRIIVVKNLDSGWFEEEDPPPCPNVYATMEIPGCENGVGHSDIHLWANNCDFEPDWREGSFEIDCPDPGLPWVGDNNNWTEDAECTIVAEVIFNLFV